MSTYDEYLGPEKYGDDEKESTPSFRKVLSTIKSYSESNNIADLIDQEYLKEISDYCVKCYQDDLRSMKDWLANADEIMDFMKTSPSKPAKKHKANIKLPIIYTAVLHMSSMLQDELNKNGDVANYKVIGGDTQIVPNNTPNAQHVQAQPTISFGKKARRGKRICRHLNWMCTEKIDNWYMKEDQVQTTALAIGTAFVKTYYDHVNETIVSEFIPYDQIIINHGSSSLSKAESITHKIYKTTREIIQWQRYGLFSEIEDEKGIVTDIKDLTKDKGDHNAVSHVLLEHHCWLDLDKDGLPEPYIVTIHEASGKILRIVARFTLKDVIYNSKNEIKKIIPTNFFTAYNAITNPDGGLWHWGLGHLLLNLNDAGNAMINILTNAGHLATLQGGFLDKSLRIKKGPHELDPGEWVSAESTGQALKDGIVPFNYKEPSNVLLQVLGLILDQSKAVSATSDLTTGQTSDSMANVSPNVVFNMMQQGLKLYTSIFRRISRGRKEELQKIVKLNSIHVDTKEYMAIVSPPPAEIQEMFDANHNLIDYDLNSLELQIVPIVDDNQATEGEMQIKAQAKLNAAIQLAPYNIINLREVAKEYFESLETENADQLILPPAPPPPPDPKLLEVQQDAKFNQDKIQLESKKLELHDKKLNMDHQVKIGALQLQAQQLQIQGNHVQGQHQTAVSKVNLEAGKLQLDATKVALTNQHDNIQTSLDFQAKAKELQLQKEELALKRREIDKNNV
jgi:chaperonin GroES